MHIITRNKFSKKTWQIAILAAIITVALITRIAPTAASSQLATVNFDLYAVTGATTLPDQTVNVWGYNTSNTAVTKPGGPTLIVNEGDTVEIVLHNELSEPTSLLIRGQDMIPDLTGIAPGGTKLYSFTATQPGTYLYEAGLLPNAQHQVAMGLYGVLIVRPDPTFASVNGNFDADYANTVLADGPTHYYRLGEAAGPTAFDTVTPGSDGTYGTAVTLPVPGLLSNSADTAAGFDGASADSFVDTSVTSMSNSAFSVEAWANANTIGTGGHRIVAKDEVGVTGAWILWFNQGKLRFQVRDSSNTNWVIAEAPATPPAGTAFHAVGVFDGTDVILYLDGVEVARTALGTATVNTNSLPVTIGADSDITNPREHLFDGAIDEVALYDYALNPTRIQAHYTVANVLPSYEDSVLTDGPAHYYRLGEAAGPTAFDTVVPGNDGTYGTAVTLPVAGLLSNSADTAAGFDGASADSFVDTGVTSMSNSAFSVEAWANANTIGTGGHRIVAKDEVGVTGAWILWFNQGKLRFQVRNSSNINWVIAEAPTTPPAGTAFHAVGVFDGTDVILYLDGAEVARTALGTATVNTNSLPVTIGADSDTNNPREHLFDGTIDEVALYDYALTSNRIQAHFNAANMSSDTTLIDSTANFTAIDYLVGGTLYNNTDGSSCIIAAVTDTTLTCDAPLTGGATNIWALGDAYTATGNFAYNSLISNYDDEAILVLSEIDPALNNSVNPATFDMRDYSPKYWLINGRVFPQTELIQTVAGHKVLLRYINVGLQTHTMSLMGLDQMLLAEDGYPLPFQYNTIAENILPGQTRDTIVSVPTTTPDGSRMALYDSSMLLHNNNDAGFGGMMTFITTAAGIVGPDTAGPATSAVSVTPSLTDGTTSAFLSATVSDIATGNANIQAAEYYIDDTNGTPTTMTATDGAFDSPLEAVEATIPAAAIAALSPGDHLIYVRGQDALGNWGSFNLVTLRLELAGSGPETHGLTFTPNPSAGDVIVTLSGTGDDSATGNSNIVDAEFFVGAPGADGNGTQMAVNLNEPIASIDYGFTTTDLSGLGEGVHTVYVHSKDDFAWGAMATIDLEIDLSGPDTTGVVIAPNPNNGTLPINPSLYAARLDATLTDPLNASVRSNLYQAEFFIGTTGPDGTGIPMYARDGLFDSPTEEAYALISLVNINALGPGSHTIYVHGRDASGNWGPLSSTVLLIQQDAPTVSGTAATPNPTNGVTAVDLTAVANDAGAAITLAEWFVDADPGPGNGTAMTISGAANPWNLSATIDITGWADGAYTLYVRVQDAAGNWSAVDSTILTVAGTPPPPPPPTPTQLHFSTLAAATIPGVAGPYDDADVYLWDTNTASFSRVFDGSALGLPGNADIDGLAIDPVTGIYYVSFANNSGTNVPLIGLVQDEDVVLYDPDNGEWQTFFQGGDACGLNGSNAQDVDAIDLVGGVLYFSTIGNQSVNGAAGPYDDADIYSWTDGGGCNRVFDASTAGLLPHADVDGLVVTGVDQFYFSFNRDGGTTVPGLGTVQDEDVVQYDAGTWSLFFDGAAQGLNTSNGQDLDAIEIP